MKKIFFLFLFPSYLLSGQNLSEEFIRIQKSYENVVNMHVKMRVLTYEGGSKPTSIQNIEIKRKGSNYLYVADFEEMLLTESYFVRLDKSDKTIHFNRDISKTDKKVLKKFEFNNSQSFQAFGEVTYLGLKNGLKHYRSEKLSGRPLKTDIFIDAKKGYIKKMKYDYSTTDDPNNIVVMDVIIMNLSSQFNNQIFALNSYLRAEGKTMKGVGKYIKYNVTSTSKE